MELKGRVVKGFTWVAAEKTVSALLQLGVSLVLLNLLLPEDYATIAIVVSIIAILNTFVDSGFSQTLIRKTDAGSEDLNAVFYFNIAVAVVIYVVFALLSGPLARLYSDPRISTLGPVLFLLVPLYAAGIIQQTVLSKRIDFKKLSKITFVSYLLADILAVVLALCGGGIWALVAQRMGIVGFKSVILWITGDWRPSSNFSFRPIREMLGYSSRIFATDFINNTYNNVASLFMGKIYPRDLGYYDRALKLKNMPVDATVIAVQSVTFPALAEIRGDDGKFKESSHKIVSILAFCIFPMMLGLIATAQDIFALLLPPKWWPSIPFFKVLCIAGMMSPLAIFFNNTMKIRSDGGIILRLEIVKKCIITAILACTIPLGAIAIAWGQVAIAAVDMTLNLVASRRYSNYMCSDFMRDVLPPLAISAVMYLAVYLIGRISMPVWLRLIAEISGGAAVYVALAVAFGFEAWGEAVQVLKNIIRKK